MSEEFGGDTLEESLELLGELLEIEGIRPVHLVVVGGAALLRAGVVMRTTRDIDVLAQRGIPEGGLEPIRTLPEGLARAADQVGRELGLTSGWLNTATALLALPLSAYPVDTWDGMEVRQYGDRLQVSFLGRSGLIYLKFHAAMDPERTRRGVDRDDLQRLEPSLEESRKAIAWLEREELLSDPYRRELESILSLLGHDELL